MGIFAQDASKAWAEKFHLVTNLVSLTLFLGVFMWGGLYKSYNDGQSYLVVGILLYLPNLLIPLVYVGTADRALPWYRRFVWKAHVWNLVYTFIGNYFWTHYFYVMLGAKYTFGGPRLNDVPVVCFFATQSYFLFYTTVSSVILRLVKRSTVRTGRFLGTIIFASAVILLSYLTAYMELITISAFPYYTFEDEAQMYKVGNWLYAIYFFVGFPMFLRIDEDVTSKRVWTLSEVALDSFAMCMIVTVGLDLWRIFIGAIFETGGATFTSPIPFLSK